MRDRQKGLFDSSTRSEAGEPLDAHSGVQRSGSAKAGRKPWLVIGAAIFFAYAFLGEFLLPEPVRLSNFIGTRMGHIKGLATRGAAPDEARASCLLQREQVALKAFNECLAQKYATMPKCEFARDQAKNFPCG